MKSRLEKPAQQLRVTLQKRNKLPCSQSHIGLRASTAPAVAMCRLNRCISRPRHLTCPVYGIGSGWRTGATARLCCQAPASRVACSGALPPQSPLTDTRGAPTLPALGRKEYVSLVLEYQPNPRRGENHMLEMMEENGLDKLK